jgi:hypothetical protein
MRLTWQCYCVGISKEDFVAKYSKPSVPVVLTDLTQNWPASKTWTRETLVKRHGSAKVREFVFVILLCWASHDDNKLTSFPTPDITVPNWRWFQDDVEKLL